MSEFNEQEYIERISALHQKIKENKFRENNFVNIKYASGYFDLLSELLDTFWTLKKNTDNRFLKKLKAELFYHDFASPISISRNAAYFLARDDYDDAISKIKDKETDISIINEKREYIERNLGCIHEFIDTGMITRFYAWDRGVYLEYRWNEDVEDFEPVRIVEEYNKGNAKYILDNNIFPTIKSSSV